MKTPADTLLNFLHHSSNHLTNYDLDDNEDSNLHYVAVTRPEQRLLVLCNFQERCKKKYCSKIESNIRAINELGINIKRQDIAKCINSIEFSCKK